MMSRLAMVSPSTLSWIIDIPWLSTAWMAARPEKDACVCLGLLGV